jgi:3-methyladenine DNA glycosylase AlkC
MFTHGWWLWPVGRYVERLGATQSEKSLSTSLDFIGELTKRFTGEFAIRPILSVYPVKTLKQMEQWSLAENVHQRRLASEGVRISLPWSKKLLIAIEYFDNFCRILGNLRHAPEKFVQKSVGNNLNDLLKLYPEKAEAIIADWQAGKSSKAMEWIIKHGRRSIGKQLSKKKQKD